MTQPAATTRIKGRRVRIGRTSIAIQRKGGAWRVVRRENGSVTQSTGCPTLEAAKLLFRQWESDLRNSGAAALGISDDDRMAVSAFRTAAAGMTPAPSVREVLERFIKEHAAALSGWTVNEAIDKRLHEIDRSGLSKRYYDGTAGRLRIFGKDFGKRPVSGIKRPEIEFWLHRKASAPATFSSYQRLLHGLFECALRHEKATVNPAAGIRAPKHRAAPPGILTPAQCRALLAACPPEILPAVAIQGFAGLRRAEVERLQWADVKMSKGLIDLSATVTKTASRRLVEMPRNLIAWLLPLARPAGPVTPSPQIYRDRLDAARTAAGIKSWPSNCLRHSAASYKCALEPDLHKVAQWLGNSAEILLRNYRELVESAAAKEWFAIAPDTKRKILRLA